MRVVEVVSGSGGGGKGSLEVGPHICCKGSDVGVGVGSGEASGARDRNSCMWKREKESAIELSTPGMCLAVMWKFCMAAIVLATIWTQKLGFTVKLINSR